jgi:hypothetical protein
MQPKRKLIATCVVMQGISCDVYRFTGLCSSLGTRPNPRLRRRTLFIAALATEGQLPPNASCNGGTTYATSLTRKLHR